MIGVDPDVNDPTVINHSHSIVPTKEEDWPKIEEIIDYSLRVRARFLEVLERPMTRRLARILAMVRSPPPPSPPFPLGGGD